MNKIFALVFYSVLLVALCAGCNHTGPSGSQQVRKPAPVFPTLVKPVEKLQPAGGEGTTAAGGSGSTLNAPLPAGPAPLELKPAGESQVLPTGGSSSIVLPVKATPMEKPRTTTSRDKVSATGFHDKDQDEPTQERPNPLDTGTPQGIVPLQAPPVSAQPMQVR